MTAIRPTVEAIQPECTTLAHLSAMIAPSLFVRPPAEAVYRAEDRYSMVTRSTRVHRRRPIVQAGDRVAHVVDRSRPRRAMALNDARGDDRQHDDRLRHRVSRLDGGSKRLLSQSSWPGKTRTIVATVPTTTT